MSTIPVIAARRAGEDRPMPMTPNTAAAMPVAVPAAASSRRVRAGTRIHRPSTELRDDTHEDRQDEQSRTAVAEDVEDALPHLTHRPRFSTVTGARFSSPGVRPQTWHRKLSSDSRALRMFEARRKP